MPAGSAVEVWQLVDGNATVHNVDPPEVNVTVPVAPPGSPAMESVSCDPYPMEGGDTASVMDVSAFVTVKLAPDAVAPLWLLSPEYVAVTGYVPGASVAEVSQLAAGRTAAHRVEPPDVKVSVPVAPAASPETDRVSAVP